MMAKAPTCSFMSKRSICTLGWGQCQPAVNNQKIRKSSAVALKSRLHFHNLESFHENGVLFYLIYLMCKFKRPQYYRRYVSYGTIIYNCIQNPTSLQSASVNQNYASIQERDSLLPVFLNPLSCLCMQKVVMWTDNMAVGEIFYKTLLMYIVQNVNCCLTLSPNT